MKATKTLLAAAVAFTFAGSAAAADVQMYGLINLGMSYVHSDNDQGLKTDKFTMENAQEFGSRWGLRGSEDLGNGTKISFVLESGFEADTGALDSKQNGRLFGRESSISLSGKYGTVSAGLLPIFGSVLGANGLFRAIDPLFGNYCSAIGSGYATASLWTRVNNAVSYKTPTVGGLTGYAMYSFQMDSKNNQGTEGKSSTDRYGSLALRYQAGTFEGIMVADTTLYGNQQYKDADDGYTVTLGGNYTFSNGLKLIAFGQWFDSMLLNFRTQGTPGLSIGNKYGVVDGWGASIGFNYPVLGGVAKFGLNHREMDNTADTDFTRWTVMGAYDYNLSKRTALYAMTGYTQEKVEKRGEKSVTPSGYEFCFGILHRF
ncbi:MAG: porin [Sutterella sp.]|nr:porin [Sutterella sp.]